MPTSNAAPENARDFAQQRDMILSSRRALHLGFFSWLPMLGLLFGPAALMHFVRARHSAKKVWNPVEWQRRLGGVLATTGILMSGILLLLAIGDGVTRENSGVLIGISLVMMSTVYGIGLWGMGRVVELNLFKERWQRIASAAGPMAAWTLLWVLMFLEDNGLRVLVTLGYWIVLGSPLLLLCASLFSPALNAFFHRNIWLTLLCVILAWGFAAMGGTLSSWVDVVTHSNFLAIGGAAMVIIVAGAVVMLISAGMQRVVPSARAYAKEHPEAAIVYTIAFWMAASLVILLLMFIDKPQHRFGL